MLLDQIAGHERARAILRHAVTTGQPAHAYLFLGPPSVGKTATALAFAGDLFEAAGSLLLTDGVLHPDLWVEDSDAEGISIDVIRKDHKPSRDTAEAARLGVPGQPLQAFLSLRGMHSDRRVAVIARAERLKETAASPLLKTIEEPPEGVVLVLCAQAADLLPATIRSRCQVVDFNRLSEVELRDFLTSVGVELPGPLLRLAQGRPGLAMALAADPEGAQRRLDWGAALESAGSGTWLDIVRLGARFGGADSARNRALAREALDCWEGWIRDFTAGRAGAGDAAPSVPPWSGIDLRALVRVWESAREAADRVENNVNPRLAIEVFLADVQREHAA
ncbi:MAG TPA: hypothetical protein VIN56_12655 [Candidatus Dormibacteraeota bacterium]|jgi:hypothetical protein